MYSQERELTLKEKFAIKGLAYGIIDNWYDAFHISYEGKAQDSNKLRSLKTIVSRWKNNPSVKTYFDICKYQYIQEEERKKEEYLKGVAMEEEKTRTKGKEETREESVHTKSKNPKLVDFSNPQNQMQKLNELVNSSEDVGETLDALKVIISTQKADRESAREGKQVKAYLPMTCTNCPLYNKARK